MRFVRNKNDCMERVFLMIHHLMLFIHFLPTFQRKVLKSPVFVRRAGLEAEKQNSQVICRTLALPLNRILSGWGNKERTTKIALNKLENCSKYTVNYERSENTNDKY